MEGMFFLRDNNIIMSTVTLRSIVVYLEQSANFQLDLSLKVGIGTHIFKFHELRWNPAFRRWQRETDATFPWPSAPLIQLELYHTQESPVPVVVAEGTIPAAGISSALQREIRISLLFDGLYVGCLFCEITNGGEGTQPPTFFYLHKIEIILIEQVDNTFTLAFQNNLQPLFEKKLHMHTRNKTLFPNLKIPVKMSDVATIALQHDSVNIKQVRFVMDSVKRGKTSIFQTWLRNSMKNKVGVIKLQYFLENMFLDNDRQTFPRNGIFPAPKKRQSILLVQQDKDHIKKSVIIKQLQEADCRITKCGTNVRRMRKDIEDKENKPTITKAAREIRGTRTLIRQQ